uniref:Staphylococcal nuclease domain-containing protein n=1 Tax=Meloidogyne incognita TaxID=6306 RepID=A0A914M2H7_MELIC
MVEGPVKPVLENNMKRGFVKQVLSGDSVVLQFSVAPGSPPNETTVYLCNVVAPRLAKRPTENTAATPDEPYAWEAREFIRKKLVGQTVTFVREFTATSGREHGHIYLGGTGLESAENVTESAVSAGLLEVRPGKQIDESTKKLLELQEQAKEAKKGRWSGDEPIKHVRSIQWSFDDPRSLVTKYGGKPVDAVIEQVRDGSTVRAFLLPSFDYVTIGFSGVKTPGVRVGTEGKPEEFGEEAKFFVEIRLLQRDVKVILESTSNQNFIGSVLHPRGNIAEFLLRDGLAKCLDWTMGLVTGGGEKLREAENFAKQRRLRIWKNFNAQTTSAPSINKSGFSAKVVEIGLCDSLSVLKDNGEELKVYFSSLRPPRREGADGTLPVQTAVRTQPRPLYDIPFMFEAREYLRKRLIDKRVTVMIDYVQPKQNQFPEKTCCTILFNGQNVAIMMIERGYAKVIRHRNDDDNRSQQYDQLIAAETKAEGEKKGLWADKTDQANTLRVQELQGDAQRSKQFLPYLQRSQRIDGLVEFVASASRLRVYVPKESCLITFLLSGINAPRTARIGPNGQQIGSDEPFAVQAMNFTRYKCLQHDVQIEVETMDKAGGFIGYLFVQVERGVWRNLSELLVENGLASVHFTAERSSYYTLLTNAERIAKAAKLGIWKHHVEEEQQLIDDNQKQGNDTTERKLELKKILLTEVYTGFRFAAQTFDDGLSIEKLMNALQLELKTPSIIKFVPKRNQLCAAKYTDGNLWHRARVEGVKGDNVDVLYIDFGNRETLSMSRIAPLPPQFQSQAPFAKEYQLALVSAPPDPSYAEDSLLAFKRLCFSKPYLYLNVEYRIGGLEAVTVFADDNKGEKRDLAKKLITDGYALVEKRREARFQQLVDDYVEQETKARKAHLNIWRYGDFTGNEL